MRLPRSLQWRIALAYTALIFVTMGVVSFYLVNFVRDSYVSNLEVRLEHEAALLGQSASASLGGGADRAALQALSERTADIVDARVTIIAEDGTVLADTHEEAGAMENQGFRPEVAQALAEGIGRDTRVSRGVGAEMMFTAAPVRSDGASIGVARIAVPTSEIQSNVNRIIATITFSALVVAFLSVGLGFYLARRTARSVRSVAEGARRLAGGDLEHRVTAVSMDETQQLAEAFNSMAATIRDMIRDLSGERNKLSVVLDTMADGVIVIGPDDRISLMNRTAESLLDVTAEQAIGSRLVEVVRDHELQAVVSQSVASGQLQQGEVDLLHLRRSLSAIANPLSLNGAEGVLLTLHDLTRIREVDTTRREFVSNVSHELRNPLASVRALVESLERGALDDGSVARDFLRRIRADVDRMSGIVDDLLELSRMESGQPASHLRPVELRPLIEGLVARFGDQYPDGPSVDSSVPDDLPAVTADDDKVRQVLVNLMENACKFTPGDGSVSVSASVRGQSVEVSVVDTGTGIAAEHIPHVFERFYKVDRARRDGGTGLGLAIVKHTVQALGGEVGVTSAEGSGSTFWFTLQRAD